MTSKKGNGSWAGEVWVEKRVSPLRASRSGRNDRSVGRDYELTDLFGRDYEMTDCGCGLRNDRSVGVVLMVCKGRWVCKKEAVSLPEGGPPKVVQ
jgi:hypothetical protein